MKNLFQFLVIALAFHFLGCGNETQPPAHAGTENLADASTVNTLASPSQETAPVPNRPMCKLVGSVLEGNMFWAAGEKKLVVISAEPETEDKTLGESHRILSVYDENCGSIFRQVLPMNISPDFPYYLSEITYNNLSKQVAIRGADKLYILDLTKLKLNGPLVPKFLNERYVEDARSGNIERIELWENYLIGYAASMGPFVFDLSDANKPTAVLPTAEFALVKGEEYVPLFLLKSTDGEDTYQALMPDYNYESEAFSLNVLFEKPLRLNPTVNKSFRNNRFLLLKETTEQKVATPKAIDMKERKFVELPAEIAQKKDAEILSWLKAKRN